MCVAVASMSEVYTSDDRSSYLSISYDLVAVGGRGRGLLLVIFVRQ